MRKINKEKELFWETQVNALRDPVEILTGQYTTQGLTENVLKYKISGLFLSVLEKAGLTLLVSREYEHLVLGLSVTKGKLRQSFLHIPHPSGIAVDRKKNSVFIASTRNPNSIWELKPMKKLLSPKDQNYTD